MNTNKYFVILLLIMMSFGVGARAQTFTFNDITKADLEKILQEFSANFTHTSVSGAAPLGKIFGFEFGLVGGQTETPEVNKLVRAQDPSMSADQLYHGSLLGILSLPLGLTGEVAMIPEVGNDDLKFKTSAMAIKWSPTETLLSDWPFSLALKAHIRKTELSFKQKIDVDTFESTVSLDNTVSGLLLLVSKDLLIVEPYAGFGMLKASGDLSYSGTSSQLFDPSLAVGSSASTEKTSSHLVVGAQLKLFIFKLGAEYEKLFDTSRISLKAAFYF